MMSPKLAVQDPIRDSIAVHIGDVEALFDWAGHANQASTIVIAPVELHRRNLKLRLAESNRPLDAFSFTGPAAVGSRLLQTAGKSVKVLDRIDRLSLLGDILSDQGEARDEFRLVIGGEPSQNGDTVEQVRRELEVTTNYHPTRVRAFRRLLDSLPSPIDVDASHLLDGSLAVERAFRRRTDKIPSDGAMVRRATRAVSDRDDSVWAEAYPAIDRVALVGLSTVPATLVDLLTAIALTGDVEVHIFLREGTGQYLERRLPDVWSVSDPGDVVVA